MLASKSLNKHSLFVRIDEEFTHIVTVMLIDATNRIIDSVHSSSNHFEFEVQTGLYTIRIELNGEIKDQVIVIDGQKKIRVSSEYSEGKDTQIIQPPMQHSSAPLSGVHSQTYHSSHEYYTYPAIHISQNDTFTVKPNDSDSSLFIFIRFPSREKYKELRERWRRPFYSEFELVDEFGNRLIYFGAREGVEIDENFGSVAFSAQLPNGIYYLIYHGYDARQIPIYVFKNWHTQFFLTLGSQPLFGSIRIFIARNRQFDPAEKTNKYIDVLLDKLQNRDYSVDQELITIAAHGKYESPMLGLICSYIYLKSKQTKSDELFSIIERNMRRVILKENDDSPDLFALKLLAAEHFGHDSNSEELPTKLSGTPMLRLGFETIQRASVVDVDLITKAGINDFISESLYYDSPFNTFKPIEFYKLPQKKKGLFDHGDKSPIENFKKLSVNTFSDISGNESSSQYFRKNDYSSKVTDLLDQFTLLKIKNSSNNFSSDISWVQSAIADIISDDENVNINDIATEIGVSGNTVSRILSSWKDK